MVEEVNPQFQILDFKFAPSLLSDISTLYQRLDEQIARMGQFCQACGHCCDFESFGHRLYLTTPELLYFAHHVGHPLKPMTGGVCPYRIDGQCSVYPFRFAGCRIFQCKGDPTRQGDLSEAAITQFKHLCDTHQLAYRYMDLKTAVNVTSQA